MKNRTNFFSEKSLLSDVKAFRKILVCCLAFVSVFSLRVVAEKQQIDFSIAIAASETNQIETVVDTVVRQDRIDLNSAQLSELQTLPGIGPKLAATIIKSRKIDGPFREASDLLRIKGIGSKKLEKITPYLRFDPLETK